jgi:SAM-dependent methyltransferase
MRIGILVRKAYRRTYRAVRLHGFVGTLRLGVDRLRSFRPGSSHSTSRTAHVASAFDQRWGVKTDGNEDLSELKLVDTTNYLLGAHYEPTAPEIFQEMLSAYPLPYEDSIFIDCGSGKGRVLLLAAELPFRRIIGVDFATDWTEIARANIRAYNSPTQRCRDLEVVCSDATLYDFPVEPTVLYIYNPFAGPDMAKLVRRIEDSLREHPRQFFVLYRNPKFARVWDDSKFFVRLSSSELSVVYGSSI